MLEIIRLDHQGRGIGTINNKVIFIPNTIPGEIIEYKITNEKKNYLEGKVTKYTKKSKDRINPQCPYYNICGGCQLMHMPYEKQLKYKQNTIENILSKYTNSNIKINPIIKSENEFNYRNKITLHINKTIGLYKQNSNEIININKCYLVNDKINNIIKELNKLKLEKDEIVIKCHNNQTLLYYNNKLNNLKSINADNIILNNKIIKGNNYVFEILNNYKFKISPTSFFQINKMQTIKLYENIKKIAQINKKDNILDLYCGTGTIGIYLSKNANKVLGIEINKEAIKNAKENQKLNNIKNIEFIAGDVKDIIKKITFNPTIIVLDPPRSGINDEIINYLINYNAKKIIYISCNPITLARDLKKLNKYYTTKIIQPLDMFPNTYHIECITLLTK